MNAPLITAARLQLFARRSDYMAVAPKLEAAARRFGIDTPREVRHWLAHLHVESQGFTRLVENLNYTAKRLTQVWPSRFPTLASAAPYANNPRALANKVYGRRGGNIRPDDGWLFRGSGPGQITFRGNFAAAGRGLGVDLVGRPELMRTWATGSMAAAWFWESKGLNRIVAKDDDERIRATLELTISENEFDDVRDARVIYNGGLHGFDEVKRQLLRAATIWGDE
jgi:putative chitinase